MNDTKMGDFVFGMVITGVEKKEARDKNSSGTGDMPKKTCLLGTLIVKMQ